MVVAGGPALHLEQPWVACSKEAKLTFCRSLSLPVPTVKEGSSLGNVGPCSKEAESHMSPRRQNSHTMSTVGKPTGIRGMVGRACRWGYGGEQVVGKELGHHRSTNVCGGNGVFGNGV